MPRRHPPWLRADNIGQPMPRRIVDGLLLAMRSMPDKRAPWPDNDPAATEAWWHDVLHDPRGRLPRDERIPRNGEHAHLRLDRCREFLVTLECIHCRARATYDVADLRTTFGDDQNITALPINLVPCPETVARRDGACRLRLLPGGFLGNVRPVGKVV